MFKAQKSIEKVVVFNLAKREISRLRTVNMESWLMINYC